MTVPSIPMRAVRALFLQRQHLTRPRAHSLTAARLVRFVEDVGGIQLDSINVVERAHYLTVWSRFGPYERATLDRLVYERRLLFEYWAHAACLVPVSTLG
ncbi:MAG TPA: crosslink repair DNA glycosylase YcaQ family protein, partial [Terriglobales bacterium]|nr:crosslink repair DNA glycosylase YcaQ family protein [Terriglobales bacterium]